MAVSGLFLAPRQVQLPVQLVSMVTSTHKYVLWVNFVTHEYFFLNIHDVNYPLANTWVTIVSVTIGLVELIINEYLQVVSWMSQYSQRVLVSRGYHTRELYCIY